eukprot:TRINITY_DN5298_c0_g2_i1.p1 TRINITY_DN5298_c0_g2~~TRINITY_DN5298_c0_g2_i1.p1  ORF type:complete len:109 (-),score=30.92 TRINITY_DN5298_c0_g2_i1:214-540(-)
MQQTLEEIRRYSIDNALPQRQERKRFRNTQGSVVAQPPIQTPPRSAAPSFPPCPSPQTPTSELKRAFQSVTLDYHQEEEYKPPPEQTPPKKQKIKLDRTRYLGAPQTQ